MENRIPDIKGDTVQDMQDWFNEMEEKGLLFHPDDNPREIVSMVDDKLGGIFTEEECAYLDEIMDRLFELHGDSVYEAGLIAMVVECES